MTLQALLWDVDGTLAETERDGHRVAFNLAFAEMGLPWGWDERRYGELLAIAGGRERLLADMVGRADAPATPSGREALARRLHEAKNRHYARLIDDARIELRPGVRSVLAQAAAQGLQQIIVTTTSRTNVQALCQRLLGPALSAHLCGAICGDDVERKKPDPQAHRLALARLGLAPAQVLAVEDSPAGRAATAAAGVPVCLWPSVYFPQAGDDLPATAGFCHPATQALSLQALRAGHVAWHALPNQR